MISQQAHIAVWSEGVTVCVSVCECMHVFVCVCFGGWWVKGIGRRKTSTDDS